MPQQPAADTSPMLPLDAAIDELKKQKLYAEVNDPQAVLGALSKGWVHNDAVVRMGPAAGLHGPLFDERKMANHLMATAPSYIMCAASATTMETSFEAHSRAKSEAFGAGAFGGAFEFSASVAVANAWKSSTSRSSAAYYLDKTIAYTYATVANAGTLDLLRDMLLPSARAILDAGPPAAVWSGLGSHFLKQAAFGACASYSAITSQHAHSSAAAAQQEFEAAVKTPWGGGGVDSESLSSERTVGNMFKMVVRQDVAGGQPHLFMTGKTGEWHRSACTSPVLMGGVAVPISELAGTQGRRDELKAFFVNLCTNGHTAALKQVSSWPVDPTKTTTVILTLGEWLQPQLSPSAVIAIYHKDRVPANWNDGKTSQTHHHIAWMYAANVHFGKRILDGSMTNLPGLRHVVQGKKLPDGTLGVSPTVIFHNRTRPEEPLECGKQYTIVAWANDKHGVAATATFTADGDVVTVCL